MESNAINVGTFVRCTTLVSFPVGEVIAFGPELDNPNKGDCFAYVRFKDWDVLPVLKSTLVKLKRKPW